MKRIIFSI